MQRIFTERAHLMCPNMFFGIAVSVDKFYNEEDIGKAISNLSKAHPFLCSLLGRNEADSTFYYDTTSESKVELILKGEEVSGVNDSKITDEYTCLTSKEWDLRKEGMLKVIAFKNSSKTIFLLVVHHLLTDGRGAFLLSNELADAYLKGIEIAFAEEKLISSKSDMPKNSTLPFISKMLVNRANNQWKKENHRLSYDEYINLANKFLETDKISRKVEEVSSDTYKKMVTDCHEHSVSVNDYLMAKMYIEDNTEKIIIAYDLREKLNCYNKGALGNYSTAFSVVYKGKKDDIWNVAKEVRSLVKKISSNPKDLYLVLQCYADLNGDLLDATFASTKCGFESKAASFIGSMFFGFSESKGYSITNLGRFTCESIDSALFIPPASPATKKTLGVLTVNDKMYISSAER